MSLSQARFETKRMKGTTWAFALSAPRSLVAYAGISAAGVLTIEGSCCGEQPFAQTSMIRW